MTMNDDDDELMMVNHGNQLAHALWKIEKSIYTHCGQNFWSKICEIKKIQCNKNVEKIGKKRKI